MAKILIDIPEDVYKKIQYGIYSPLYAEYACDYIKGGVALPYNATNGDVLKAIFSGIDFYEGEVDKIGGLISFYAKDEHSKKRQRVIITADWWNTPYKAGDTE